MGKCRKLKFLEKYKKINEDFIRDLHNIHTEYILDCRAILINTMLELDKIIHDKRR